MKNFRKVAIGLVLVLVLCANVVASALAAEYDVDEGAEIESADSTQATVVDSQYGYASVNSSVLGGHVHFEAYVQKLSNGSYAWGQIVDCSYVCDDYGDMPFFYDCTSEGYSSSSRYVTWSGVITMFLNPWGDIEKTNDTSNASVTFDVNSTPFTTLRIDNPVTE